jgi:beta-glucosidase
VSWPVEIGQIPVFYAKLPTGRPFDARVRYTSKYLDMPNEPLFSFGHGLSYTRFVLDNLHVDRTELRPGETVAIEVDVANVGDVAGEETVLLFVRDPVASVSRPVLELKGMAKIALAPGEQGTVRIPLETEALAFVGSDLQSRLEPGLFELFVGPSASQNRLLKICINVLLD